MNKKDFNELWIVKQIKNDIEQYIKVDGYHILAVSYDFLSELDFVLKDSHKDLTNNCFDYNIYSRFITAFTIYKSQIELLFKQYNIKLQKY